MELHPDIFAANINQDHIHQTVKWQQTYKTGKKFQVNVSQKHMQSPIVPRWFANKSSRFNYAKSLLIGDPIILHLFERR